MNGRVRGLCLILTMVSLLQGCGGEETGTYTVMATVTGLAGNLEPGGFAGFTLEHTDADGTASFQSLLVQADGPFTFRDGIPDGATWRVTFRDATGYSVKCEVANGEGVIATANVTNVDIDCIPSYSVGGPVKGISVTAFTGMVLEVMHNGVPTPAMNTGFLFTQNTFVSGGNNGFLPGDTYDVRIATQPQDSEQKCIVRNATGTVGNADVVDVEIHCSSISVEFSVEGLIGSGMQVVLSAESEVNGTPGMHQVRGFTISNNGSYVFAAALLPGQRYEVSIVQQPSAPQQACFVENGEGVAPESSSVTGVRVICPSPLRNFRFDNQLTRKDGPPLFSGTRSGGVVYETYNFSDDPVIPLGSISGFATEDLFRVHIDQEGVDGVVYSNHSGKTFWVVSESPQGVDYPRRNASHHNITELDTWWLFRKESDTANLQLEVSEVYLLGFDDTHRRDATGRLYAEAQLWVGAYMKSGDGELDDEIFSRHGGVGLQGKLLAPDAPIDWALFTATDPEASFGLWDVNDFFFDLIGEEAGREPERVALAFLVDPIPIPIDVSAVPVGSEFYVRARTLVLARNSFSPEGATVAFLRDPANFDPGDPNDPDGLDDTGSSVRILAAEGLTMLAVDEEPQPGPGGGGIQVPACESSDRSTLQFGEASYRVAEGSENATRIRVTRSGIPAGPVSARIRLTAGTAAAGSDFETREFDVRFGDLDNLERTLELPIIDDDVIEPHEELTVSIVEPQGCAVIGPQNTAAVTIADDDTPPANVAYTLGGTVSGLLGAGLTLTNLSTNDLSITANGEFAFARTFGNGSRYEVRVAAQPQNPRQFCAVANGSGTISGADVSNILVTCETLPDEGAALDPSFGNGGRLGAGPFPGATAMALQADGRIVVAGRGKLGSFGADGMPDASFGTNGEVPVQFYNPASDVLTALAVQADGGIVVAGYARDGVNSPVQEDIVAARFSASGVADSTFGTGGQVITDFETRADSGYGVLLQSDGAILVTGSANIPNSFGLSDANFAAVRYTAAGALDASFDSDGKTNANVAGASDLGYASVLQPDGKIVIAGRVANSGGANPDIGLVRFNADGSLDANFGNAGIARDVTPDWDEAAELVVQPDGKLVVVGHTVSGATSMLTVARYNADGSPDANFGSGGRVVEPLIEVGRAIALAADGSLIVAGRQAGDFAIARYTASGALDATFGTDGILTIDFFGGIDTPEALAVQPDGRILVAGSAANGTSTVLGLARLVP